MKMRPAAAAGEILAKPGLTDMKKFLFWLGWQMGSLYSVPELAFCATAILWLIGYIVN